MTDVDVFQSIFAKTAEGINYTPHPMAQVALGFFQMPHDRIECGNLRKHALQQVALKLCVVVESFMIYNRRKYA